MVGDDRRDNFRGEFHRLDVCVEAYLDQIGARLVENAADFPSLFGRAFKYCSGQRKELPHQIRRRPGDSRGNGDAHGVEFLGQFADLF